MTVHENAGTRLRVGPIEAIDCTPVVDIKAVLIESADAYQNRQDAREAATDAAVCQRREIS